MKLYATILLVFFLQIHSSAQISDSLKQKLFSFADDTNKVRAYFDAATSLYISNLDLAGTYCDSALALSEKLKYDYGIAESCGWISYVLQRNSG